MSFAERIHDIRTGFERPFWVANVSELFERLAYYAAFASLARYLNESLGFSIENASSLTGLFGGLVWFLAIFGGTLADRLGFRRSLALAYLILSIAYFSLGSVNAAWLSPIRHLLPLGAFVAILVMLPALGIALVKPCVVGTTARASKDNVRSIGYSIYYTLVNIGGFFGPIVASYVHKHMAVESVFRVAALCVFAMFFAVLVLFKEPRRSGEVETASIGQALRNFGTVVANFRFLLFLIIFSGYWIAYWQEFIILPSYVAKYIDPNADTERMLATGPLVVICLTIVFNVLAQKMKPLTAVILGTFISGAAWLLLAIHPTVPMAFATLVCVAIGEITQAPRYYDYVSRLAPSGQQGTYMGFAFLPIGIGSLIGGKFVSGPLMHHYGEVTHQPTHIWFVVAAIGIGTGVLLFLYDRLIADTTPQTHP